MFVEVFPLTYLLYNFVPFIGVLPYQWFHIDFSRLYAYGMIGDLQLAKSNMQCSGFDISNTTTPADYTFMGNVEWYLDVINTTQNFYLGVKDTSLGIYDPGVFDLFITRWIKSFLILIMPIFSMILEIDAAQLKTNLVPL